LSSYRRSPAATIALSFIFPALTIVVTPLVASAGSLTVFSDNFESGQLPGEFSNAGEIDATEGYNPLGFGEYFLHNSTHPAAPTFLELTGLPEHTTVDISFLLAIIDSWDGNGENTFGPDFFNVRVDGVTVFSHTFSNKGDSTQSYSAPPGGVLADSQILGFNTYEDSAYIMGLEPSLQSIPHSGSTLFIEFFASGAGWQGNTDESWAIDNVVVCINAVPEPASVALLAFGGLIAIRRKRQA